MGQHGFAVLKADTMAKLLGVSRGSFYWHFRNLSDFQTALLEEWEKTAVDRPYANSILQSGKPKKAGLQKLIAIAFKGSIALEGAVASWANNYQPAAEAAKRVNSKRYQLLQSALELEGHREEEANLRAYLLLSAYLGRMPLAQIYTPNDQALLSIITLLSDFNDHEK